MQPERERRLAAIERTRLGGIDRIIRDMVADEPILRYAHVLTNGLGTNVHTTDDPAEPDAAYDDSWTLEAVIDLDTGDLVCPADQGPGPLGLAAA